MSKKIVFSSVASLLAVVSMLLAACGAAATPVPPTATQAPTTAPATAAPTQVSCHAGADCRPDRCDSQPVGPSRW